MKMFRSLRPFRRFVWIAVVLAFAGIAVPQYARSLSHKARMAKHRERTNPAPAAATVAACVTPPAGLVGWWAGDGNAKDIQNGNTGTLNGTSAGFANAEVGQGFLLNPETTDGMGSDFVDLGDPAETKLTGSFTLDAWINPKNFPDGGFIEILTKWGQVGECGQPKSDSFLLALEPGAGSGTIQLLGLIHTTSTINSAPGVAGGNIPLNTFTHVAMVYDAPAATLTLYINGNPIGPVSIDGQFCTSDANVLIGSEDSYQGPSRRFSGIIDEVEIFNTALTGAQINAIYSAGASGKCKPVCTDPPAGLVAWWPGNGSTNDIQGGKNGTLQNGAAFTSGKVDQAFAFDGTDDYVSTNLDVQPSAMTETTWDAWVFPEYVTVQRQTIFTDDDGGNDRGVVIENGNFVVFTGSTPPGTWTPVAATENVWQHVAVVYAANGIRFYKDGVEYTFASAATNQASSNTFTIGANPNTGPGDFFDGDIDEVEVFNVALTAAQIQAIANAGTAGKCVLCRTAPADMVGWWTGDGSASDAQKGNHGSLAGASVGFSVAEVGLGFNFAQTSVNDQVTIPHSTDYDITSPGFTADFWMKATNNQPEADAAILDQSHGFGGAPNGWAFQANQDTGGNIRFAVGTAGGFIEVNGPNVLDGQFHHIAGVFNTSSNNIQVYVDGVSNVVGIASDAPVANTGPLVIGARENGTRYFRGLVDEVEVFHRALSTQEIQGLYDVGAAGKCKPAFALTKAVSRKIHGSTPFDVDLPLDASPGGTAPGVECRLSGGAHTLVFTFNNVPVSGTATFNGTGTPGGAISGSPTFSGHTMTVELSGVDNPQHINIVLTGVTDAFGQVLPSTTVYMDVVQADTNADGDVNSADVSQTKSQSGRAVTELNFREDLNDDGSINSADISVSKAGVGHGFPEM